MTIKNNTSLIKFWIVCILLFASVVISYSLPRAQYSGSGFISKLSIPYTINDWSGKDVTDQLNLDFDKNWNKFISEAKISQYVNISNNKSIIFILLEFIWAIASIVYLIRK